jgi:2,4-dienoyl-CoA reductase (NADPH2)
MTRSKTTMMSAEGPAGTTTATVAHASSNSSPRHYPNIFTPLRVCQTELRNRLIMGAMHTRLESTENAADRLAAYYGARAKGGVALIITGGYAPNLAGLIEPGGPILHKGTDLEEEHQPIVQAVHEGGAKILLQILHTGRYGKHPDLVAPSPIRARINPLRPRELSDDEIVETIEDYVNCARLAAKAGYDGVEVMGSEGYLINQFTAMRTNKRTDRWGGCLENRIRFPIEIVRRMREHLPADFIIMYRISALDLVEEGATAAEINMLARAVEEAGADILNTGVGWHESSVPTIAYTVPRGAFRLAAARLKDVVSIPVVASNRINTPELAEEILASGDAQLISMARPFLSDPEFCNKAAAGRRDEINICIACNQACLDHAFSEKVSTCLVNPMACRETEFTDERTPKPQRIGVIGSGPAGLAFAINAARRGHEIVLFDDHAEIGGQLNLAVRIPGKQEFYELLRYFRRQLEIHRVDVRLGKRVDANVLAAERLDRVVVASGILPRTPEVPGIEHPSVVSYTDVIRGHVEVGKRVAIIGTGGIGHDVAALLTAERDRGDTVEEFCESWGVDQNSSEPGGVIDPLAPSVSREVTMFQRGNNRIGSRLGKSTGWIHRSELRKRNVSAVTGAEYICIDDEGLHYRANGVAQTLTVDTIVLCAGQEPLDELVGPLTATGILCDVIGGARFAGELDALRAIDEGTRLAHSI